MIQLLVARRATFAPSTIVNVVKIHVGFVTKDLKKEEKENSVVQDHFQLTGKFRGFAHNKCDLNTRNKYASFVPIFFHNFFYYDCHMISEKLLNMATEKGIEIEGDDIVTKSSENCVSVKIGGVKFLNLIDFGLVN